MSTGPNSATMSPPPPPSSDRRDAAIQELRRGTKLAALLRQQVELMPELDRRGAAVANVSEISMAMESSLTILQSETEHPSSCGAVVLAAHAAYFSDDRTEARNGAVARTRKLRHRRGRHGEELSVKEIQTEAPENDQFHWRKYGEKKILNAEYPRLYYKCGYSDDRKCPAKKYVQQQNNGDPPVFMVTLINEHTCETMLTDEPSSTSGASRVLDFTKASVSSRPLTTGANGLKKEEEDSMSSGHSYSYDEYLSSSPPSMSPNGDRSGGFCPGPSW